MGSYLPRKEPVSGSIPLGGSSNNPLMSLDICRSKGNYQLATRVRRL